MGQVVVMGAMLTCTQGAAPTPLNLTPENRTNGSKLLVATIMDFIPMKNIAPFGNCKILTAAASGTPTPCVPATVAPWVPGSPTVMVAGKPALTAMSKLQCTVGGTISITSPGQATINAP